MKHSLVKVGLPVLIIIAAVLFAMLMVMSREAPEKVEQEEKAFLVNAKPVALENLNFKVEAQGTVRPKVQTVLSTQVSGKVVALSDAFVEGGMFKKGDVLVKLEQADYITDMKAAEAELARVKAALEEEQARGKVAEVEWRSVKNSVAPELGLRKPQLAEALANVRAAEAELERAQRNLDRTLIKAPYDGLVKTKDIDVGQYLTVGETLGTVFGTDIAEVRLPLTDNDLAYLNLNDSALPVSLTARVAGKNHVWQGKLVRSEGVLDEDSRVIYGVVEVKDPYVRISTNSQAPLRFGRFVRAQITGERADNIVVLPRQLLRLDGSVIVVKADMTLKITHVNVVRADEENVYIDQGLEQGDLIATSVIPNPYDGMTVRLPSDHTEQEADTASDTAIARAGDE